MWLLLSPRRQQEKDRNEEREKEGDISWPHATKPPLLLPWQSQSLSGSICWQMFKPGRLLLAQWDTLCNSESATRLRDTCSHSTKPGHVSVKPHATRLTVKEEWLLAHPLRRINLCREWGSSQLVMLYNYILLLHYYIIIIIGFVEYSTLIGQ